MTSSQDGVFSFMAKVSESNRNGFAKRKPKASDAAFGSGGPELGVNLKRLQGVEDSRGQVDSP